MGNTPKNEPAKPEPTPRTPGRNDEGEWQKDAPASAPKPADKPSDTDK